MDMHASCPFYRMTSHGVRCVLMDIGDWRKVGKNYMRFCKAGGKGCPVFMRLNNTFVQNRNGFVKVRGNVLLGEKD